MLKRSCRNMNRWANRLLIGGACSSVVLATAVYSPLQSQTKDTGQIEKSSLLKNEGLISRKIIGEMDRTGLNLKLYQYQTCPFCCKVRAALDYYGFSYEVIEVNPITRKQLKFSKDYKKVPIVVANGEVVITESSLIVSVLSTLLREKKCSLQDILARFPAVSTVDEKTQKPVIHYPNKYYIMANPDSRLSTRDVQYLREEREWRQWVDDHFVHLISPNVYRTWKESFDTFRWFSEVGEWEQAFPMWERYIAIYLGAVAMHIISKRLKKRHEIVDERQSLLDACNKWMDALGSNRPFMGGPQPNLADLALYGCMNSFVGCDAFKEVCEKSSICEWYGRMRTQVESRAGSSELNGVQSQ
ncbi:hypothetical protein AB6A40_005692 [Gnathostoma spinigerum]|uniref:Prostaglandin E synthase 2 n=1 Tax=Gnathostoma spinigerum TaxID=75299 RepID=A0ABD6EG62_9BILA